MVCVISLTKIFATGVIMKFLLGMPMLLSPPKLLAAAMTVTFCLLGAGWRKAGADRTAAVVRPTAPTHAHYFSREWRPRDGGPRGLHYVGARVCIECHQYEASELQTPMGRASETIQTAGILLRHPRLSFTLKGDLYRISRTPAGQARYRVRRGSQIASWPLDWAFGLGNAGQTYLYKRRGSYYESHVSFYNQIQALDTTLGYGPVPPRRIWTALGRRLSPDETRKCFVCHTTGAYLAGKFRPSQAVAGATCEECHGPGSAHVAAMRAQRPGRTHIFNPAILSAGGQMSFCGSCHRTTLMVLNMRVHGIVDVRFQPYRLALSQCWNPTDARIGCLACHNPHQRVVTQPAWYDSKCLACHVNQGQSPTNSKPGMACPVARHNCVTCHMPELRLPGAHFSFADHDIRIVRPGQPYPG